MYELTQPDSVKVRFNTRTEARTQAAWLLNLNDVGDMVEIATVVEGRGPTYCYASYEDAFADHSGKTAVQYEELP